jgi:unsaturated rhamnogalacturonyl hydrolase
MKPITPVLAMRVAASLVIPSSTTGAAAQTPAGKKLGIRFADMILERWPDPVKLDPAANGWEYNTGIVLFGLSKSYERTRDRRYLDYIRKWVDTYVDERGNLRWEQERSHNLDYIQPAMLILTLYEATGDQKYRTAAKLVRESYAQIPKNADGGFWHKKIYPNEMWVDGIYMAEPFLVRYAKLIGDRESCYATAEFQTMLVAKHSFDPRSGLLYHAWDQDRNAEWADPRTGLSPCFWGRGMGWFTMALVDMMEDLPGNRAGRKQFHDLLKRIAAGLKRVQDPKTGLWFQVLDQGARPGNWIETSASMMFTYAIAKGVRLGYLDRSYGAVAERAWRGIQSLIEKDELGRPVMTEAVRGMGAQKSFEKYVSFERLKNSTHGLMAIQIASSEMER